MSARLRPALSSLPSYVPGRTVPGAIKLASNETPYPPLPNVVMRITEVAGKANRYPDNLSVELGRAISDRFGVDADQIAIGCGSVSLCQQLVFALVDQGDDVIFGWRSFEAYPIIAGIAGANAVKVALTEQTYDLDAMAAAITDRTRLIFVCNPNNPTSTAVDGKKLTEFLAQVPDNVVVALDEAYREFVTDPAVIDGTTLLGQHDNLIVLRTFSKAYGLAGLRVGYAIAADPALVNALRQVQSPFAVTQVGQAAALACLEPETEKQLAERVDEVTAERARVSDELKSYGYAVPRSQANFVWLGNGASDEGGIDATSFAGHCEAAGVIVRPFADSGVRVTIGSQTENDRFLAAARAARPA